MLLRTGEYGPQEYQQPTKTLVSSNFRNGVITLRSRPTRKLLCPSRLSTSTSFPSLNIYILHPFVCFPSGGSLYFNTVPFLVLVAAANNPDNP